jgi:hypothetical protein
MKQWLCRHGLHHWIILEVDDYCTFGKHFESRWTQEEIDAIRERARKKKAALDELTD